MIYIHGTLKCTDSRFIPHLKDGGFHAPVKLFCKKSSVRQFGTLRAYYSSNQLNKSPTFSRSSGAKDGTGSWINKSPYLSQLLISLSWWSQHNESF